jgi:hypothetical protein
VIERLKSCPFEPDMDMMRNQTPLSRNKCPLN